MTGPKLSRRAKNLLLAGTAGLAGFASVVIIFTAFFLGLWLDSRTGSRPLFTISLLVLSVPVSLFTMLKIATGAVKRIIPQVPPNNTQGTYVQHTPDEEVSR
jgi:ABC-type dipeptide/oligopeptide/nickel transport system permease component